MTSKKHSSMKYFSLGYLCNWLLIIPHKKYQAVLVLKKRFAENSLYFGEKRQLKLNATHRTRTQLRIFGSVFIKGCDIQYFCNIF